MESRNRNQEKTCNQNEVAPGWLLLGPRGAAAAAASHTPAELTARRGRASRALDAAAGRWTLGARTSRAGREPAAEGQRRTGTRAARPEPPPSARSGHGDARRLPSTGKCADARVSRFLWAARETRRRPAPEL